MRSKKHAKEFTVRLIKRQPKVGMNILYEGKKARVIRLSGNMGDDFCVIKLDKPDHLGNTVYEIRKSSFDFLTYPAHD